LEEALPTIFEPKDLPVAEKDIVKITTLANQAMLGTDVLQVQHITLEAGTRSESFPAEAVERFLYVINGQGQAHVGEQRFPLEGESVLWLEKDDAFALEAGAAGLEVLLCHAPAGA
jgi:redox-sensitive bicupin YhaK (pirin superfamily)